MSKSSVSTAQLHISDSAHDLLSSHGVMSLLAGVSFPDLRSAKEIAEPLIDANSPRMSVAIAYQIGIMQGIHNERNRRK